MKLGIKWIVSLLALCCMVSVSNSVMAYTCEAPFVDFSGSTLKISAFFNSSEIDYESDDDDRDFEVERKIIGLSLSKGISNKLDIFGTFGYLFDGAYHGDDDHVDLELDDGYSLSAGARYIALQSGKLSGHLYGQFDYIMEEKYTGRHHGINHTLDIDGYEITLGGALKYEIDNNFSTYAGVSFIPIMDLSGHMKRKLGHLSDSETKDFERDDKLGFKIGGDYRFNNQLSARGEVNFGTENSYVLSVGAKF